LIRICGRLKKIIQKILKNIWRIGKELLILHPRFEGMRERGD
jgi:hypothetical protein